MRRVARVVVRPLVVGPLAAALIAAGVGALAVRSRAQTPHPASAPVALPTDAAETGFTWPAPFTPPPAPKPKPKPRVRVAAKAPSGPNLSAFRGLGSWVDLYDYPKLEPEAAVADMHAHRVKTLYLQTGRWNKPDPKSSEAFMDQALMSRWLTAAHAAGMKVIGWYLPAYNDMLRDIRRTRAIAVYRSATGQRFDALAIDVEYKGQMPSLAAWNAAIIEHITRVRALVGSKYPIGAIVPAPLAMAVRPENWTGFPWRPLAGSANVFLPMAYWSFRDDCSSVPEHCAYGYTKGNVEQVRALTRKPNVPIHVIGGVGDSIADADVARFVSAARAARAYGGSLYDYLTTKKAWWSVLAKLN